MKKYSVFGIAAMLLFLISSTGFASNITISDLNTGSGAWYNDNSSDHNNSPGNEDQEVEPGMVAKQEWDLEAFLLNGTMLSIVSGYDLQSGYGNYAPGHIFIDVDGDAVFGDIHSTSNGNKTVKNTFGYDYVITPIFSSTSNEYKVYSINNTSDVETAFYKQNQGSSPWQYAGGGTFIESGSFDFDEESTFSYDGTTFGGTQHYIMSGIDLSFLGAGTEFIAHYTMQCGNDNLMGQGAVPTPEPSTFILMGLGICAFFGFRRR